jgi:glycosyltransferase involved in cell wall biosynthesis
VYVTYPALPLLTRPFNGWLCARALRQQASRFKPDVILSYWLYPDAAGALRVARELGVPLVAGARGSDIRVRDPISRQLTTPVVRQADRLLVVSADLGRLAVRDYEADPDRIRVIANGCDAAVFHRQDRSTARAQLGIAEGSELALYVGRLVAEKGLRELAEAMQRVRETRPHAELVLVGDGPLREEFERFARTPDSRLRLIGAQPPEIVAQWMAACDLLTLPSYSEGHPNVLVEALACGTPVVASDCPYGPSEILEQGRHGRLAPVGDASALARALDETLREGKSPAQQASWRARARVFDAAASARGYAEVFQRVVGAS